MMNKGFLNISVGLTVLGLVTSGMIWLYATVDGKIEPVEAKAQEAILETVKLTEAVDTIKKDNAEIKNDIKEILRRVK